MTEARQAAEDYRERLGWPAFAHGSIVWMTPGIAAEALNMPRELGHRVRAALADDGPVFEIPAHPARWVFLTRVHPGPVQPIEALVAGHGVGYAHGRRDCRPMPSWGIDLPPTRHPGQQTLRWITRADLPLPDLITIVTIIGRL